MIGDLNLVPNDYTQSKAIFEIEKDRLSKAFTGFDVDIQHIGSTAIPGTIGKGIIDVLVICNDEHDQALIKDQLIAAGYIQGELNKIPDGRLYFYNTEGQTHAGDVHLHLVLTGDEKNLVSLKFRDYMLKHPEEVENYNQEKKRLAGQFDNSRHEYVRNKGDFIEKVMEKISQKY